MSRSGQRSMRRSTGHGAEIPFTARSVIASTLLGMRPPQLPTSILVRSCALFGIAEGTTRVAISRMTSAGELEAQGAGYRLVGSLLSRQDRQDESRRGPPQRWDGRWSIGVVVADGRTPGARTELRAAAARLRLAELREGVWLRPANLSPDRSPEARAVIDTQCRQFLGQPEVVDGTSDEAGLASSLWDLDGWAERARTLEDELGALAPALEEADLSTLAPGFVLSAAVLRHFQADPLLPVELLPSRWPGSRLRAAYDRFDPAFTSLWRTWYRSQR